MNSVFLIGRAASAPECKTTVTGKWIARFTIAVDNIKGSASFIPVTAWDKTADVLGKHLTKGRLIAVTGRLEQRRYQTKEGQNRDEISVVADNVQFLDKPEDSRKPVADPKTNTVVSDIEQEFVKVEGEYDPFEAE